MLLPKNGLSVFYFSIQICGLSIQFGSFELDKVMFPDLYSISYGQSNTPVVLHTYGLMLILAFAVAAGVGWFRLKKVGIHPDVLLPIVVIAMFGGIMGARLLHFLGSEPSTLFADPLVLFKFNQGGMAFLGGAIAAGIGVILYAKRKGIHPWKLADALAPSLFLGLSIGRLGCFAAGCCHGAACDVDDWNSISGALFQGGQVVSLGEFPWIALVFERGVGVGAIHGAPTFPTQLWESAAALCVFLGLSLLWSRWRKFDGIVLATGMLVYPMIRATIELFRGDTIRGTGHLGGLSTSQVVAVCLGLVAISLLRWRSKFGLAEEQPVELISYDEIDAELDDII
jgi:phosphatidylglycerol:prolipoprotein diacylglycerol transferase